MGNCPPNRGMRGSGGDDYCAGGLCGFVGYPKVARSEDLLRSGSGSMSLGWVQIAFPVERVVQAIVVAMIAGEALIFGGLRDVGDGWGGLGARIGCFRLFGCSHLPGSGPGICQVK